MCELWLNKINMNRLLCILFLGIGHTGLGVNKLSSHLKVWGFDYCLHHMYVEFIIPFPMYLRGFL